MQAAASEAKQQGRHWHSRSKHPQREPTACSTSANLCCRHPHHLPRLPPRWRLPLPPPLPPG